MADRTPRTLARAWADPWTRACLCVVLCGVVAMGALVLVGVVRALTGS